MLDGVETVSGTIERDRDDLSKLEELVKQTNCVQSVGIDAHKPNDFERFVSIDGIPEKTCGTLESMIEKVNPQLEFSNIT